MRVEVVIAELAPGGDGVAIVEMGGERRAVFARGTCPGDRAVLEVDASKRPARGRLIELLAGGEDRVRPACAHVERCGGCDWLHIAPIGQARHHAAIVGRALPKGWDAGAIVAHPAKAALGYRTRARLHARSEARGAITVGMHEVATHEPAAVDRCVVLDPTLDAARGRIAGLLEGGRGRGEAQIALGQGRVPVLELRWKGELPGEVYARIERAIAAAEWAGARVFSDGVTKPATIGDPTPWMRGADGAPLRLAPGGFAQPSEDANEALATRVAELAAGTRAKKTLELFAGAGNLSVLLARATNLVAVESDRATCDAARANVAARGLDARVVEADAESFAIGAGFDLTVLDPPRTGARGACANIAARAPKHVLYVSCDPQTLGRDLADLSSKYEPSAIETFEMFPGTSHVETVALLRKRRG